MAPGILPMVHTVRPTVERQGHTPMAVIQPASAWVAHVGDWAGVSGDWAEPFGGEAEVSGAEAVVEVAAEDGGSHHGQLSTRPRLRHKPGPWPGMAQLSLSQRHACLHL